MFNAGWKWRSYLPSYVIYLLQDLEIIWNGTVIQAGDLLLAHNYIWVVSETVFSVILLKKSLRQTLSICVVSTKNIFSRDNTDR